MRLIRTNLDYKDVEDKKEQIAQTLFNHIPVGVGTNPIRTHARTNTHPPTTAYDDIAIPWLYTGAVLLSSLEDCR